MFSVPFGLTHPIAPLMANAPVVRACIELVHEGLNMQTTPVRRAGLEDFPFSRDFSNPTLDDFISTPDEHQSLCLSEKGLRMSYI